MALTAKERCRRYRARKAKAKETLMSQSKTVPVEELEAPELRKIVAELVHAVRESIGATTMALEALGIVSRRVVFRDTGDTKSDTDRDTVASGVARVDQDLESFSEDTNKNERESARDTGDTKSDTDRDTKSDTAPSEPRLIRYADVTIRDPLTPEMREIAAEFQLEHLGEVWAAFVGHYDGRTLPSVSGAWYKWCARQRGIQRTERARDANRARLKKPDAELQAPTRDLSSVHLRGEAEKRSRARERETEAYGRKAVPAPLGELLAACRPKAKPDKAAGS
jgi:hypothetical protein